LGHDNGDPISLRTGRFGPYVQRGEATTENPKPPRASLPKGWTAETTDLDRALMLLNLPRAIGAHPEDGQPIEAAIGRYGPYLKHGSKYANLADADEVFTIGMNRAVEVLAAKQVRGRGAVAEPLRVLGDHPSGGVISVMKGKYGPYVKWDKVNATLPKDMTPENVTAEQAIELLAAKAGTKSKSKAPAKKAATAKAATKAPAKKAAKKPAAAKTATAKPKAAAKPKTKATGDLIE
jgi:DNA topoisomerase-1